MASLGAGVGFREWHPDRMGQGPDQEELAAPGRTDEEDQA
jgi:hypothetical protein